MNKVERFAPRKKLLEYAFYSFYKKNKEIPNIHKIDNQKEFFLVVKTIWEVVAKNLIERNGGVVLDGFGYLCNWMTPDKKIFKTPRGKGKLMINYHTESYWYNTNLFTNIFKTNHLKSWTIDRAVNTNIKKGIYKQLLNGKKYKFYLNIVKNLYTDRYSKNL